MSPNPRIAFLVEVSQYAPRPLDSTVEHSPPVDLTERLTLDGSRWMVYESDHDLAGLTHDLKLIEDV